MPTSPLVNSAIIVESILATGSKRILDVGMGTGKYGFLVREQTDFASGRMNRSSWHLTIDGVEGYGPNIGDHQRTAYDNIFNAEALQFLRNYRGEAYDLVVAIEIIEHFKPEDGVEFARAALRIADHLLISTPKSYFRQRSADNTLEWHRSWWPAKALVKLAKISGAHVSIQKAYLANLVFLSRKPVAPQIKKHTFRYNLAWLKDSLVPELLYYKLIGGVGPTILDLPQEFPAQ